MFDMMAVGYSEDDYLDMSDTIALSMVEYLYREDISDAQAVTETFPDSYAAKAAGATLLHMLKHRKEPVEQVRMPPVAERHADDNRYQRRKSIYYVERNDRRSRRKLPIRPRTSEQRKCRL